MPSFAQICDDVITRTGRPELVKETVLAVRHATKQAHMVDFWLKDTTEQIITFPLTNYSFVFDIPTFFPRYRKVQYIKKYDIASQTTKENDGDKIREGDPADLFDRFGARRNNIYYRSGTNLNLLSSSSEQAFIVGWWQHPDVNPESFKSWIADEYDVAIVDLAAAKIFRDIGMTDDANRLDQYFNQVHVPILTTNGVMATA